MKHIKRNLMDDGQDKLMNSAEVRAYLGIGHTTLSKLYQRQDFPACRIGLGGAWKVRRSALDRWLDDLSGTPDKTYYF